MSETVSFKCDICKVEKGESNHWWKGYLIDQGPITALECVTVGIMIIPWSTAEFSQPFNSHTLPKPDAHLCGEQHAMEWASRNLTRQP